MFSILKIIMRIYIIIQRAILIISLYMMSMLVCADGLSPPKNPLFTPTKIFLNQESFTIFGPTAGPCESERYYVALDVVGTDFYHLFYTSVLSAMQADKQISLSYSDGCYERAGYGRANIVLAATYYK
jgi:hypothetical protein